MLVEIVPHDVGSIKDLKADISNLIHQEELFCRQRSHSI